MNEKLDAIESSIAAEEKSNDIYVKNNRSMTDRHPKLYLFALSIIALLGCAYLFLFPLTAIFIAITLPQQIINATTNVDVLIILTEILLASICTWVSFYLLKMKLTLPSGRPVTNKEAPKLFKLIEKLQAENKSSKIHRVRITSKYEIDIIRTPRNGFPILCTNTLLIGLPFMQSLSEQEFNTALLREFSHITKIYRRPTGWFYFLRQTWCQYRIAHQSSWHLNNIIMRAFFSWYSPLFKLLSQGAVRNEELHADKFVLKNIDKVSLAELITTSGISKYYLDNYFWPHLYNKAYKHKTPPYLPYSSIERNLHTKIDNEISHSWLDQAVSSTQPISSFPSFSQRLANIELKRVMLPAPVMKSAANYYFENHLKTITSQFDKIWFMTHQFDWQQKYKQGQEEQNTLEHLKQKADSNALNDQQTWEYILLIKKYVNTQDAIPLLKQILKLETTDARIRFDIGRTLLLIQDEDGIRALESAMAQDPSYTVMSCQLITKYFVSIGNSKSAQMYRRRSLVYQVDAA